MTSLDERRKQLQTRRAELVARMQAVEEELGSHADPDWEDMAVERETDEVLEGMGLSAQTEVARIDAALKRVDAGEYGICVKCGATISEERLDLVPFTPFCHHCAA